MYTVFTIQIQIEKKNIYICIFMIHLFFIINNV